MERTTPIGRDLEAITILAPPGRALDRIDGVRWADLDEFGHFRVATSDVDDSRLQFTVAASDPGLDPASDTALCRSGWVTATPLSSVEPAPFPGERVEELFRMRPG
ncbi:MAG TPA: hypothetical protein VGC47_01440 [Acidimicrobiia bacterium]|jgi:hypothetical protein